MPKPPTVEWVLLKPLSADELKQLCDADKRLQLTVPVPFATLADGDSETLDGVIEESILQDPGVAILKDIGYAPVGLEGRNILIRVTATVVFLDDTDDQPP